VSPFPFTTTEIEPPKSLYDAMFCAVASPPGPPLMNRDGSQRIEVSDVKAELHMSALSPRPWLLSQAVGLEFARPPPSEKPEPSIVIVTPLAA
jgi:hypothetical protein